MALVINDRVKETSTTTGTDTLDLAGAVQDFEGFVAGIGNSNTTYYAIVNTGTGEFEVGLGTVTDATPDTLSRDTIISSSNSDASVNFSAGTKDVFCTLPASKAVVEDENNDVTLPADLTIGANLDVSSGTIKLDGNFPTGTNNVALGNDALATGGGTGGGNNTMIGNDTGSSITSGQDNTGVGDRALRDVTTGLQNTGLGKEALSNLETGGSNVAVGHQALLSNVSGSFNIAVGHTALPNATLSRNTAVGYSAGSSVTTGQNLTLLGYNAEPSSATATNEITLGNTNVTSLRIPGLASGASSGDVLTYDGTDITLSTPSTGVSKAFVMAMGMVL